MKQIPEILFAGCLLILLSAFGCGNGTESSNPYYERMKKLGEQAEANPSDRTALNKLKEYATDSDYWNRVYAYGWLGDLAIKNVSGCQAELIPLFGKLLENSDPALRRSGAETILGIGSAAVDKTLPSLLKVIQQGREDDVTWFSTQALGKLEKSEKARDILPDLLNAASRRPPAGTQDSAPQVRYYALNSIKQLATKNKLNVIPQLEKILSAAESPYKARVAETILALDPGNTSAQQAISSGEKK